MEEQEEVQVMRCERCGEKKDCMETPFHGYSEWLCRSCTAAAYRNEEAV